MRKLAENTQHSLAQINETVTTLVASAQKINADAALQQESVEHVTTAMQRLSRATHTNMELSAQLNSWAQEVREIASRLYATAEKTRYHDSSLAQTCDIETMFAISSLKLDHILLREEIYNALNKRKTPQLTDHIACKLGHWFAQRGERINSALRSTINRIIVEDERLHRLLAAYIKADNNDAPEQERIAISQEIEEATATLFHLLDLYRQDYCKDQHEKERENSATVLSFSILLQGILVPSKRSWIVSIPNWVVAGARRSIKACLRVFQPVSFVSTTMAGCCCGSLNYR